MEFTALANFGNAVSKAGVPEIGSILNGTTGSLSYWEAVPAYWTAVLVNGKDPKAEAVKLNEYLAKNLAAGAKDL
jgi:hypothetical protein